MTETNHYERGQFFYDSERYQDACKEFKACVAQEPDNFVARSMLALSMFACGDEKPAIKVAQEAMSLAPDEGFPFYTAAFIYFQKDDLQKARKFVAEALNIEPFNEYYLDLSARIYFVQSNFKDALKEADKALEIDPEHVSALNARAMSLIRLRRANEAFATADTALKLDPENYVSHANKGWLLLEQNRGREAMDYFKEALRLNPGNEWAREGIVESLKHRHFLYGGIAAMSLTITNIRRSGPLFWILWIVPPLRSLYLLLAITAWFGNQVFNLVLCLDPFTRHVLTAAEKRRSGVFAGLMLLLAVVIGLACSGWFADEGFVIAITSIVIVALPLLRTAQLEGLALKIMIAVDAGVLAACGMIVVRCHQAGSSRDLPEDATSLLGFLVLVAIGSLFVRPPKS